MTLEEVRKRKSSLRKQLNELEQIEEELLIQKCKIGVGSIIVSNFLWENEVTKFQIIIALVLYGDRFKDKYVLLDMKYKRVDIDHLYDSIDEIKEMMKNDRDNLWEVVSI